MPPAAAPRAAAAGGADGGCDDCGSYEAPCRCETPEPQTANEALTQHYCKELQQYEETVRCKRCYMFRDVCGCPPKYVKDVKDGLVDIAAILEPKEDLDALAADIEDPTVSARDMRAKKRARAKQE